MVKNRKEYILISVASLIALIFTFINYSGVVESVKQKEFENICNIIFIFVGIFGFCIVGLQKRDKQNYLDILKSFFSNIVVVIWAYTLNLDVFENNITNGQDLFKEWYVFWSPWAIFQILFFTGIIKTVCEAVRKSAPLIWGKIKSVCCWFDASIKNCPPKILFVFLTGIFFWIFFLLVVPIYIGESFSTTALMTKSLLFGLVWMPFCIIIIFFAQGILNVQEAAKQIEGEKVIKRCLIVMGAVGIFTMLDRLFPVMAKILEVIFFCLMSVTIALCIFIYIGKKTFHKSAIGGIKRQDVGFLFCVFIISIILIFIMGIGSNDGSRILENDDVETMKLVMELFAAGMELIKQFVF